MIAAIKALFEPKTNETDAEHQHRQHLAAASLLIETARADFSQDAEEERAMESLLASSLNLGLAEVRSLIEQATNEVDWSTSLYEFTRVINDNYSADDKLELLSCMWRVAYADGRLDKYEEHLIRQVAELTYIPHSDYIRCKLEVQGNH